MSLAKKYQIPIETVKRMVKDGVISCSIDRNYEIYDYFLSMKSQNPLLANVDLITKVSENMHVPESTVEKVVYTFGKNYK